MEDKFEKNFIKVAQEKIANLNPIQFAYNFFNLFSELVEAIKDLKKPSLPSGIIQFRISTNLSIKEEDHHLFVSPFDYEILTVGCSYIQSRMENSRDKIKIRFFDYTSDNYIDGFLELSSFRVINSINSKIGNIIKGHTIGVKIESETELAHFDIDLFMCVKIRD